MLTHSFFNLIILYSGVKTAFCRRSSRYYFHLRPQGIPSLSSKASCARPSFTPTTVSDSHCCRRSQYSTTPPDNPQIEYNWIDGVERLESYEPGGYHPVMVDDLLHGRYRVVDKLGYGGYSTIWLCQDVQLNRYVALKVGVSGPPAPRRESNILRALSSSRSPTHTAHAATADTSDAIPSVLDEFEVYGPNGSHPCYTVAPAQGNLREASFSRLFPIRVARALAAKLTMAVAFVHSQGFVHGGWFLLSQGLACQN